MSARFMETEEEKAVPFTEEERVALREMSEAYRRGDYAAALEHVKRIRFIPEVLMSFKEGIGADFIRETGLNTELADERYGPGWLDK